MAILCPEHFNKTSGFVYQYLNAHLKRMILWGFYWNYMASTDEFGENWNLSKIKYLNPWTSSVHLSRFPLTFLHSVLCSMRNSWTPLLRFIASYLIFFNITHIPMDLFLCTWGFSYAIVDSSIFNFTFLLFAASIYNHNSFHVGLVLPCLQCLC